MIAIYLNPIKMYGSYGYYGNYGNYNSAPPSYSTYDWALYNEKRAFNDGVAEKDLKIVNTWFFNNKDEEKAYALWYPTDKDKLNKTPVMSHVSVTSTKTYNSFILHNLDLETMGPECPIPYAMGPEQKHQALEQALGENALGENPPPEPQEPIQKPETVFTVKGYSIILIAVSKSQ